MKPGIIASILVIVILGVGGVAFLLSSNSDDEPAPVNSNSSVNPNEEIDNSGPSDQQADARVGTYTMDEVERHNSKDDCWTVISGSVYDITSYVPRHPGGDEILRACGEDATTFFNSRQDEDGNAVGSGTPHSSNARSQLESLKIGVLKN